MCCFYNSQFYSVRQSGFQTPIAWEGRTEIRGLPERIRFRVTYDGVQRKDIHFSALYVQDAADAR